MINNRGGIVYQIWRSSWVTNMNYLLLCKFSLSCTFKKGSLTLVRLNKLTSMPTSNFQPIRLLEQVCWYKFTYLMTTVQIQFSWLLKKPADLDLHCLQSQGISGFSRTRIKMLAMWKAPYCHKQTAKAQISLHCLVVPDERSIHKILSYFSPLVSALQHCHTCHKLWSKICETRHNFKGDLAKCEIFLNITLELP